MSENMRKLERITKLVREKSDIFFGYVCDNKGMVSRGAVYNFLESRGITIENVRVVNGCFNKFIVPWRGNQLNAHDFKCFLNDLKLGIFKLDEINRPDIEQVFELMEDL